MAVDVLEDLKQDVARQMSQGALHVTLNLGKGTVSNTPSTPSPLPITANGKDMDKLIAADKMERENSAAKARAKGKAGKQKVAMRTSSSSESSTATSSEGEPPRLKAKATPEGKEPTLKSPHKAAP